MFSVLPAIKETRRKTKCSFDNHKKKKEDFIGGGLKHCQINVNRVLLNPDDSSKWLR